MHTGDDDGDLGVRAPQLSSYVNGANMCSADKSQDSRCNYSINSRRQFGCTTLVRQNTIQTVQSKM